MTDEKTRRERATTPTRDRPTGKTRDDPYATPLGSGGRAGPAPDSYPLSSTDASITGARGHSMPAGGDAPSDRLTQANDDARSTARRTGQPGQQSESNEANRGA